MLRNGEEAQLSDVVQAGDRIDFTAAAAAAAAACTLGELLAEGYASVTLVDIRYISPQMLGQFISFTDQDVLFLYSTSVLNNSEAIK